MIDMVKLEEIKARDDLSLIEKLRAAGIIGGLSDEDAEIMRRASLECRTPPQYYDD